MYYKKCNTCNKKTCLKTNRICKSMDEWLKRYVEVPQREYLPNSGGLADLDYLTQGIDNKEDM